MPTIKKLYFANGTDVTAPTDLSLESSTNNLSVYADDAAFVTANGTAQNGDVYINSTLKALRGYVGGAWRTGIMANDLTDATKTFGIDLSAVTAATNSTLSFVSTASRTFIFPDANGILVLAGLAQTLDQKTLTNSKFTSSFDVSAPAPATIAGSIGANTLTLGGATSTVEVAGDFVVQGATTTLNTATLDVEDKNITINRGGNDASSQGAGITVDRTGTKGSLVYDSAATSKWKAGALGSEVELLDKSSSQIITNKDIDGGTASNTSRIALPKAAKTTLDGLTRKQAVLLYASDTDKVYKDNGVTLTEIGGSGSGSGEINTIATPNDVTAGWATSGAGVTMATTSTASDLPLGPIITTAIKITPVSGTDYVYYRFTMPEALKNKKLKIEWHQRPLSGYASGDLKVDMYKNSASNYGGTYTRFALSTDSSAVTSIPNLTGKFTTYFDTDSSDYYELRYARVAGTTALNITSVIVGPGIQPQGAVVSGWQSYTPTITGLGTVTNLIAEYARIGEEIAVKGSLIAGTPTASNFSISLPSGLNVKSSLGNSKQHIGKAQVLVSGATASSAYSDYQTLFTDPSTSASVVYAAFQTGSGVFQKVPGNSFVSAGNSLTFEFRVPIAEWAGSGTLNTAQNDVEYAYNTNTADSTDTTSFANKPDGVLIGAFTTTTRKKRVRFLSPIQDGDVVSLEFKEGSTGSWIKVGQFAKTNTDPINSLTLQGATGYGAGIVYVNSTDVDVLFYQYAAVAGVSYASAGLTWSSFSTVYWRVKKEKAGTAVGFGLAGTDGSAGLYKAGQAPGLTTGVAVGSGYVGESFSDSSSTFFITSHANIITRTLPKGKWLIKAFTSFNTGSGTSGYMSISKTSATHDATNQMYFSFTTATGLGGACTEIIENISADTTYYLVGTALGGNFNNLQTTRLICLRIA